MWLILPKKTLIEIPYIKIGCFLFISSEYLAYINMHIYTSNTHTLTQHTVRFSLIWHID